MNMKGKVEIVLDLYIHILAFFLLHGLVFFARFMLTFGEILMVHLEFQQA